MTTTNQKPKLTEPQREITRFFTARMIRLERDQLDVWCEGLGDLTLAELKFALAKFNRESDAFPTIAAVRRFAGPKGMSDEQRAAQAWDIVAATIGDHGAYRTVDFSDRIVNAVIRASGGWERLCATDSEWIRAARKQFLEAYARCACTGVGDGSPLVGIADRENGFAREKPLAIDCKLPTHAMQKRLAYTPPDDVKRIAGPVRQLSDAFAERMRTATEEKAARKAEAAAETARRMEASQAVKSRLIDQAKGLVAQEREQFMARARAKRERKRKAKV